MSWDFSKLPEYKREEFVKNYRQGRTNTVINMVRQYGVFSGKCGACLKNQLRTWVQYSLTQGILKDYA